MVSMTTCDRCPPDSPDIPENELAAHRRTAHPDADEDSTLEVGGSTIVRDAAADPGPDGPGEDGAWTD
jgi:hypothetical protein